MHTSCRFYVFLHATVGLGLKELQGGFGGFARERVVVATYNKLRELGNKRRTPLEAGK